MWLRYIWENPEALLTRSYYKLYFLYWLEKAPWPWEEYRGGQGIQFINDIHWPVVGWSRGYTVMALAGIGFAFYHRTKHGVLLSTLLLYTLACLVFFARTRFRMPIEPILILYAWLALLSLVDLAFSGYRKLRG